MIRPGEDPAHLKAGDRVRLLTGPYLDFRGTVTRWHADRQRAEVVVRWMGEPHVADFQVSDVELLAADNPTNDLPA